MLTEPHRDLNIPVARVRIRVGVDVRVTDVAPAGTGPIDFEKRRSRGVLNSDTVL